MTKSNVRSVRLRRTNRRIAHQYEKVEQERVRAYQQRSMEKRETMLARRGSSFFKKAADYIRGVFGRFFRRFTIRPRNAHIRSLDLRDRGLYANKPKRDAGAQQLRSWFGEGLKMVSTRDGKTV